MKQPNRIRRYLHPLINDLQWDELPLHESDIVIASAIKAGTTWLQTVVANLIFQELGLPAPVMDISPWVERYREESEMKAMLSMLDAQKHRRLLKTHLPIDALRFDRRLKYLMIARDPRDVFMSLWNHHQHYSAERVQLHRDIGQAIDRPWVEMPSDLHAFYHRWISEPYFEWEREGTPYWSVFYHFASWWPYRDLDNVLFVHYNDLLSNPQSQISTIAKFLNIDVTPSFWPHLLQRVSFNFMKAHGAEIMGRAEQSFKGGAATFINRGENGLWRNVLDEGEKSLYELAANRALDQQARSWLEKGNREPLPS